MEITSLNKSISLEEFLIAYKIPGVGKVGAKAISEKVKNASTLLNLLEEKNLKKVLLEVNGIGEGIISKIIDALMDIDFFILLTDMESEGFEMFDDSYIYEVEELLDNVEEKREEVSGVDLSTVHSLKGLNICITGTLSLPRRTFETAILKEGGRFQTAVSKATDILVYSNKDGIGTTKYKAAMNINKSLGTDKIKMITEKDFVTLSKSLS